MAKLSRTEHLDLSMISSLVEATVPMADNTLFPSTDWVLEVLSLQEEGLHLVQADLMAFHPQMKRCLERWHATLVSMIKSKLV